ncbi:MAG TPA: protein kinase [Polyangiaceae bacterium]|nr:protein kinase [Polyangiaceae bacterium]
MGTFDDAGGSGGAPPPSTDGSASPRPGDRIADKYIVEKILGVGGMGIVLSARHAHLGQRVAVKLMRGTSSHDPMAVERFLREARAAVALSSDHVAKVVDVGSLDNGSPYMVMEYLAGQDLGAIVRASGPMTVAAAVDAVLQACDAIAEAHSIGIVHRDLKPSNLFMTTRRDGRPFVKVLDFGISKAATTDPASGQSLTSTGMVMGSPAYMSPEQIRSAKDADARSDVWALGVILYELLSGQPPFRGDTVGETFARIFSDDPAPLRSNRPDVPPALEGSILQCLRRDPSQRVQSVTALARLIAPFASPDVAAIVQRLPASSGDPPGSRGSGWASSEVSGQREATAPAWQHTAAAAAPPSTRARWTLAAAAIGVAVAGGVGIAFLRGTSKDPHGAASAGPTMVAASAATAPPVVATSVVLPPPKAIELPVDSRPTDGDRHTDTSERPSGVGETLPWPAGARAPVVGPAHPTTERSGTPAKTVDGAPMKKAARVGSKGASGESAPTSASAPANATAIPSATPDFGY